jgi:hypothetical protein
MPMCWIPHAFLLSEGGHHATPSTNCRVTAQSDMALELPPSFPFRSVIPTISASTAHVFLTPLLDCPFSKRPLLREFHFRPQALRASQLLGDAFSKFAQRFLVPQILELGIPVLDVLLIGPFGGQKRNVIEATDPVGRNGLHTLAPRSGEAVIAIDDVESSRRDFGQQDRSG